MDYKEYLKNQIKELADRANSTGTYQFSKFHGLRSLSTYEEMKREISFIGSSTWGGYEGAERKIIILGSQHDLGYDPIIPISIIKVEPLIAKFSDKLTHRDYMGAVLNLGIDKSQIGDIVVLNNNAYIMALKPTDEFLIKELDKVKHTCVKCSLTSAVPADAVKTTTLELNVASNRLDAIVGGIIHYPRSAASELIKSEKVYINGLVELSNSRELKSGDGIAIRGVGRFEFENVAGISKKGRTNIIVKKFV